MHENIGLSQIGLRFCMGFCFSGEQICFLGKEPDYAADDENKKRCRTKTKARSYPPQKKNCFGGGFIESLKVILVVFPI